MRLYDFLFGKKSPPKKNLACTKVNSAEEAAKSQGFFWGHLPQTVKVLNFQ